MACLRKSYETVFSVIKRSRKVLMSSQFIKSDISAMNPLTTSASPSSISRTYFTACRQSPVCSMQFNKTLRQSARNVHAKSENDQQFDEFLTTEIATEKKDTPKDLPAVTDFEVNVDGPNVKLSKSYKNEIITVEFNVNNSVVSDDMDAEEDGDVQPPEMSSHPDFTVTIQKSGTTSKICLKCQLMDPSMEQDVPKDETDSFIISELAMVEGEWNDKTYVVNADLLDPNMYDMLMLMLDDRGISHDAFCDQLVEFSTEYEHKRYINMLESLQAFIKK